MLIFVCFILLFSLLKLFSLLFFHLIHTFTDTLTPSTLFPRLTFCYDIPRFQLTIAMVIE